MVAKVVPVEATEENPVPVADREAGHFLWRILQMLMAPLGYDKSLQRQRCTVIVESGTIGSVTFAANQDLRNVTGAIAAVTNQVNMGGMNADMLVRAQVNAAWALTNRARIT